MEMGIPQLSCASSTAWRGQSWAELWCQGDMRHPGEQVNDGVVIQPSAACRIHVVNGISLDQFTWFGDMRTPRVVRTDSFPPSNGDPSSLEDTSDTAQ